MNGIPTLCVRCGETTLVRPCSGCGEAPLLEARFALLEPLGRGGNGVTFRGVDLQGGDTVAIKETLLQGAEPKRKQLAEREAKVLSQLKHPAIPRYRDHALLRQGRHEAFYLVQEFVEGVSLEEERQRRRYTAQDVADILHEVAGVLVYLHDLSPPVIHRDLKPSNLMRRPNGSLALIDFGAVRDALRTHGLGGSTVAGTFGYMAPEQLIGDASPQSDLYSLGMVGAVLLTGKSPAELTDRSGQATWRRHANAPERLAELIDALLASDPERRPRDARALRRRLRALRESAPATRSSAPEPPVALVPAGASPLFEVLPPEGALASASPLAPSAAAAQVVNGAGLAPAPLGRAALMAGLRGLSALFKLTQVGLIIGIIHSCATGGEATFSYLVFYGVTAFLTDSIDGRIKVVERWESLRQLLDNPAVLLLRVLGQTLLGALGAIGGLTGLLAGFAFFYILLTTGQLAAEALVLMFGGGAAAVVGAKGFQLLDADAPRTAGPLKHRSLQLTPSPTLTALVTRPSVSTLGSLGLGAAWGAMISCGMFATLGAIVTIGLLITDGLAVMLPASVFLLGSGGLWLGLYTLHARLKERWEEHMSTNAVGAFLGIPLQLMLMVALLQLALWI